MRLLLRVVWKSLAKLMRRFGWGLLLVPVAAMGMALAGIHLWTVALVLLAAFVAVWWPAVAAGLLPVTMVTAGVAGLVVASAGSAWKSYWSVGVGSVSLPLHSKLAGKIQCGPPPWVVKAFGAPSGQVYAAFSGSGSGVVRARQVLAGRCRPGPALTRFMLHRKPMPHPAAVGWWHGRLLVPLALLLLTLGLWLAPRTVVGLTERAASLVQRLRRYMRENRWGVLLVPVALLGVMTFGLRPWTAGLVIAAVVIVVKWPKVAADLVPVSLVVFALYGFEIAARWQSASSPPPGMLGQALAPPAFPDPVQYGAVLVDSRQAALLAGAQASVFLVLAAWLVPRTIVAHARSGFVAGPDPELAGRVQRLTESRGHAITAATSELRRIERDLHDGAQARLVALGMNLRAVERMLPASPDAAIALVAEARETSLRALADLRSLIRGIYPPVLADRGLGHAVEALTLDTSLPVELDISLPGRLAAPVESACYFAVAEALVNAVRHSGARRVYIRMQHADGVLRIEVADDGTGGADPSRGTGLRGVERRLGTFDGILAVSSPPGGPTMIAMEVPCALSSPKTSSC